MDGKKNNVVDLEKKVSDKIASLEESNKSLKEVVENLLKTVAVVPDLEKKVSELENLIAERDKNLKGVLLESAAPIAPLGQKPALSKKEQAKLNKIDPKDHFRKLCLNCNRVFNSKKAFTSHKC
jgi:hypothetical protein